MASGELETVSGDSTDMKKNVREQGDGCAEDGAEGPEGATSCFQSYC